MFRGGKKMPIFRSAYDTTFGRRYSTDSTKAAIVKATVSNYLDKNHDGYTVIEDTSDIPVDIPSFSHPLYVEKAPYDGLYVDARQFVTYNRQSGEKKISSVADYNLLKARAGLEYIWRTESPTLFRSGSAFPASVYAHWLAENIQRRISLEPEHQYKLVIFSAWFYFSLFADEDRPDDREYHRVCQLIAKATKISIDQIMQVLDGQDYVKDLTDYCARLEEVVGTIRLKDYSSILLVPTLGSTWFGTNSGEIVAVAIEHIPTFLSIVLSAATERAYTRSMLSKMAERVPAKGSRDDFVMQMTATLKS
jgi:hypothetical protein